jgi:hypothetical protein
MTSTFGFSHERLVASADATKDFLQDSILVVLRERSKAMALQPVGRVIRRCLEQLL